MRRLGFRVHSSTKWKAARAFGVSLFALVTSVFMIFGDSKPVADVLSAHPAWTFAALVFLFFTLILGFQFWRVATTPFVLEFTDSEIISRAKFRTRRVPYVAIEIFSPVPETIFSPEASVAELRQKLGLESYLSLSCRLRADHFSERDGDFIFFERVAPTPFEMQGEIVKHLRSKINHFELLVYDWGDDGDETNA